MIVQSAKDNQTHLVMTMEQHTSFAAQLAGCFGNEQFESVCPRDTMMRDGVFWMI
jgi:hypothetical protein